MENVIVKYSEFFDDDQGFEKVKQDFTKLGDDLISEAKRVKKEFNTAFTLDNPEMIAKYEKQMEEIRVANEKYKKSMADLSKIEAEYVKAKKEAVRLSREEEKLKQDKINTTRKEIQGEADLNRAIVTENNAKKSNIALEMAQQRQRDQAEKAIRKEKDAYGLLSAELNKQFRESANLATEMFRLEQAGKKDTDQFRKLSSQFDASADKTRELDSALKKIDATLGRHQRNVGNYASGFNGLQNSINQISRELPAFTYNMQTGFMAISNNIPAVVDEISRLRAENTRLVADGQPAVSILGQLRNALFSFNTLISLGITLMTVYGEEIAEWVVQLFNGSEALDELNQRQKEFIESKINGRKEAQSEIIEVRKYLAVAKDEKISLEERMIAIKQLRSQYPFYFKDLSDQQMLTGDVAKAERELMKALEKRKDVEKKTELNVTNKQQLIDLEEKRAKQIEHVNNLQAKANKLNKIDGINPQIRYKATRDLVEAEKELKQIKDDIAVVSNKIMKNDSVIFQLKKETIGLEYQADKDRKKRVKDFDQINSVDYLANDFELRKTLMENAIRTNEEIFASDKYNVDLRLDAQRTLVTQMVALAEMERRESLRVLENKYNEEKNATIKDGDGKVLAKKYTNNGLLELEKQFNIDKDIIQEQYRQKERDALKKGEKLLLLDTLQMQIDNIRYLQKHLSNKSELYQQYSREISEIQQNINKIIAEPQTIELNDKLKINADELRRLQKLNERIRAQFGGKDFSAMTKAEKKQALKEIEKFEKEREKIEYEASLKRKQNRIKSIEEEQKNFKKDTDGWKQLEAERQQILIDLEKDSINRRLKDQKDFWDKFKDHLEDVVTLILDKMIEINQKRVDANEKALDNQEKALDKQQQRAEDGLTNTLAFEQKMMAEREAQLIKSQKKQERLEKIKALWTSYVSYADKEDDPNQALVKTLRDFAILTSIEASFRDGGIVGIDGVKTNGSGITTGKRHNADGMGGNLAWHEAGEGFFSRKEVANMGHDNFYKLKSLAGTGKIDKNFFTGQRRDFERTIVAPSFSNNNTEVVSELKELKKTFENKPVQNWRANDVVNGVLELVEERISGNKTERNIYQIKKNRL